MILAHFYTVGAIQDVADFVGDSLALAQKAAKTDADIIVMCGVNFMAETNKILCPDKTVLLPDLNSHCPLPRVVPPTNSQNLSKRTRDIKFFHTSIPLLP